MVNDEGYLYILKSTQNNRYYIGSTNNVLRRVQQHQDGFIHTTLRMLPIELVFKQKFDNLKSARLYEHRIKKLKRRDIVEIIIQAGNIGPIAQLVRAGDS